MLKTLTGAGSGFIFWFVAARYYSPDVVGLAVGVISSIGLLSMFTRFGLEIAIIRYLPNEENKTKMINCCLTAIILLSLFVGTFFLLGIDTFSPKIVILRQNPILMICFIAILIASSTINFQNNSFVALRFSKYSLFQSLVSMSRILLLPFFVSFKFIGIYFSYGFGIILATIYGTFFTKKIISNYNIEPILDKKIIYNMFHFSFGNYIASMFEVVPGFVFPILIMNYLSSEMSAYFYVAWSLSSLLFMIPKATATSLFVEGSHSNHMFNKKTMEAVKFILILLIPLVIIFYFFGEYILLIFGPDYSSNAYMLLKILSIGSIFYSFNELYISTKRVNKDVFSVNCVYGALMIISLSSGYFLMKSIGLNGIAIGWACSNFILNLILLTNIVKNLIIKYRYTNNR